MNFNMNWNDVYPRALYCGNDPVHGTWCAETFGYWGRNDPGRPRVVDREGRKADKNIGDTFPSPGTVTWKSRNYGNGFGSAPAKIQELLNKYMRDMRSRGVTGVPANLAVDGILGTQSHNAIVWYQGRQGLVPDGIVGNATWQRLRYS